MGFPILVRWHLYIESGPWHLASPGSQHPYWLCRISKFLSYLRKDLNCHVNVEEWHKIAKLCFVPFEQFRMQSVNQNKNSTSPLEDMGKSAHIKAKRNTTESKPWTYLFIIYRNWQMTPKHTDMSATNVASNYITMILHFKMFSYPIILTGMPVYVDISYLFCIPKKM